MFTDLESNAPMTPWNRHLVFNQVLMIRLHSDDVTGCFNDTQLCHNYVIYGN